MQQTLLACLSRCFDRLKSVRFNEFFTLNRRFVHIKYVNFLTNDVGGGLLR